MRASLAATFGAALLALTGCGGSSATPPMASQLARKIPGAHACITMTPDVLATADVSCVLTGAESVEVVTFPTMGNEQKWITQNGACYVEGHLFTVTDNSASGNNFPPIIKALGGRAVCA
jgi:hypothetical protein